MKSIENIISEAKCCSATLAARYAHALTFGEGTEDMKWDFLKLNAFIRILVRNRGEIKYKKEVVPVKSVDTSSLERKNSFLSLKHGTVTVCTKTKISPCLSDSEISHITEQIRLLCTACSC